MPLPCLPVDSAISCSAQRPKLSIGGDTMNVTLSRPWSASSPITRPSQRPEFELVSSKLVVFASATWARPSSASTFTPASAAGTSPK